MERLNGWKLVVNAPEDSSVNNTFEYIFTNVAHVIIFPFGVICFKKVRPDSNFVFDTQEASVSNFPNMAFLFVYLGSIGFRHRDEVLSNHLKEDGVYMGNGASGHVEKERR